MPNLKQRTDASGTYATLGLGTNESIKLNADNSVEILSLVYTPAGTGAVPTDVQSKLREVVSVKDFGAVGDGQANDTAAFSDALAHCKANNKALRIPDGVYILTSDVLNFAENDMVVMGEGKPTLQFIGAGKGFTLDAGSAGLFKENMRVENLIIKGGPDITDGFYSRGTVRSIIRNVEVQECSNAAFNIVFSVSCTFDTLKYSCGVDTTKALYGLYLNNSGTGFYCADNTFINPVMEDNPAGYGCFINSGSGNIFIGGTFEGLTNGLSVNAGCRRNSFYGLWMEANSNYDAADGGELTSFTDCHFGSASSLLNLQISTGQGCTVRGGYLRAATVQSTSKETLFLGVGFDQNTGGTLGIQGGGTYRAMRCLKIDNSGNVVGSMPDATGNGGQTLQDVTGSRALAITYTNSTGSPIHVYVAVTLTSGGVAQGLIDGVSVWNVSNDGSATKDNTMYLRVPAGSTYRVDQLVATATLSHWKEVR